MLIGDRGFEALSRTDGGKRSRRRTDGNGGSLLGIRREWLRAITRKGGDQRGQRQPAPRNREPNDLPLHTLREGKTWSAKTPRISRGSEIAMPEIRAARYFGSAGSVRTTRPERSITTIGFAVTSRTNDSAAG